MFGSTISLQPLPSARFPLAPAYAAARPSQGGATDDCAYGDHEGAGAEGIGLRSRLDAVMVDVLHRLKAQIAGQEVAWTCSPLGVKASLAP